MKTRFTPSGMFDSRRRTIITLAPAAAFAVVLFVWGQNASAQPSFQGVGDLPGGIFSSAAYAVSADGTTVVGSSRYLDGTSRQQAFRWTQQDGIVGIGFLSDADDSIANDVSANGSVVVGRSYVSATDTRYVAFRWTAATGAVSLGFLPDFDLYSSGQAVSADGSVVVGESRRHPDFFVNNVAIRWKASTGMRDLQAGDAVANAVSADGFAAAGSAEWSSLHNFFWHMAVGVRNLNLDVRTIWGMSPDAQYSVGYIFHTSREAFRWRYENDAFDLLGDLPGGSVGSEAFAISADHMSVVGYSNAAGGREAFIWKEGGTMQRLQDVLVNDHGLDLTGWTLREARDISDDGLTIVGWGINRDGNTERWVAKLSP